MNEGNFAPYAPAKSVLAVVRRYRETGLPQPLTAASVQSIGIAQTMTSRTIQALRFLGLVDDDGHVTEAFEALKRAGSNEYPEQLDELLRQAYRPVFSIVDPAKHDIEAIADAFRQFEPSAQRTKMVALFRGLIEEANITPPRSVRQPVRKHMGVPKPPQAKARSASSVQPSTVTVEPVRTRTPRRDYALLVNFIQELPQNGQWDKNRRESWIKAFTAALDLLVNTVTPSQKSAFDEAFGTPSNQEEAEEVSKR